MNKYSIIDDLDLIELLEARDTEINILSQACSRLLKENYSLKERLEKFEEKNPMFDFAKEVENDLSSQFRFTDYEDN